MDTAQTPGMPNDALMKVIETLTQQLAEQTELIKKLEAQIAWFRRQMYGSKSERRMHIDNAPDLFSIAGVDIESEKESREAASADDAETETITYTRSKTGKGTPKERLDLESLPVLETRTLEPEGLDLTRYRRIGEETTTLLGFEPGKYYRIQVIRPKYGLIDPTEPVERGKGVLIAPLPKFPIHKGIPDASLLSEMLLQKYEYHMPFYRQIKQMVHLGVVGLKEATMVGWYKRTMELLRPLYELLVEEVFGCDYIQADESTVPVINGEKHQADKEYLWMVRAVMERLAVFFYDDGSRAGDVIKEKTDRYNFHGYLQCDGFGGYTAAYKSNADVCLVNCLVHIRRHWEPALKENRKAASWFLGKIRELYHIEHECDKAGMDCDRRKAERQGLWGLVS